MHKFTHKIAHIPLPELFTWPFHYTPHPLARLAAEEVMDYVASRSDWSEELSKGKMFGVLVVQNENKELGFLAAFSGNLAGTNHHKYFVPPVYDMLKPGDFFRQEEANISAINRRITQMEQSAELAEAKANLQIVKQEVEQSLTELAAELATRKRERQQLREKGGYDEQLLIRQSQHDSAESKRIKKSLEERIAKAKSEVEAINSEIEQLRIERRQRSAELQMALFREFRMLNAKGEVKDLCELFAPTPQLTPPAGAGECAAPKLLQYAYKSGLHPIAMAEFWWGDSPKGEVRHHGNYYPACNSKCKPILTHMMEGLNVEPNPLLSIVPPEPRIIWEDESMVVIDKPCGMLSVDGKSGVRSVEQWARERYPDYDGPMIVHRLDQSTSGLLVVAKSKEAHKSLQSQFISRSAKKSYVALLEAVITAKNERISLPMKLDYDHRPRQMAAEDGKSAITEFEVLEVKDSKTRVRFYPITGRTHQLRLHAAHSKGLNAPIVGDDIYGNGECADCKDGKRLCLHAETLNITHPITGEALHFESKAEF